MLNLKSLSNIVCKKQVCKINTIKHNELKIYCNYLIEKYDKIKVGDGGRVMSDLRRFYKNGTIKDLIFKNTSYKTKANFLNLYKDKILQFSYSQETPTELLSFEEYKNSHRHTH